MELPHAPRYNTGFSNRSTSREAHMMIQPVPRTFVLLNLLLLAGCAANQLPGFQNVYYSYDIPQTLLDRIMLEFREHGLVNARVSRDKRGRVS